MWSSRSMLKGLREFVMNRYSFLFEKLKQEKFVLSVKGNKNNFVVVWLNENKTLVDYKVIDLVLSQKGLDVFLSVLKDLTQINSMFEIKENDVLFKVDKKIILIEKDKFLDFLEDKSWIKEVL